MKCLSLFSLLLLICVTGFAQDNKLPYDERGKLIYYEVVEKKEVSAAVLSERAAKFLKAAKGVKLNPEPGDSLLKAKGKMIINKTALVLSRPSGELLYNLSVDIKDGKYRFWLTDFNFIPYERDRYSNFVPATTIATPLENKPGKLNAGEWDTYVKAAATESKAFASKLKAAMSDSATTSRTPDVVPTVSTKDKKW